MTRRRLAFVAIACMIAAVVSVLLGGWMAVRAFDMQYVSGGPDLEFTVETSDRWVIAWQSRAYLDDQWMTGREVATDDLLVEGPDGAPVEIERPARAIRFSHPGGVGEVFGTFQAHPGVWTVSVRGGPVLLAVGPDPVPGMAAWLISTGVTAISLCGLAAGFGWLAWRRGGSGPESPDSHANEC
ncbi:MAG: hypothetical protein MK100_06515 [Phycisphaerales bacterium]|nr:hypothetical protein [Phycisphaerales bacterium]